MCSPGGESLGGGQSRLPRLRRIAAILFGDRAMIVFIGLLILYLGIRQIGFAQGLANGVSPIADGFSESNALRAGERFAEQGFTANFGLPDIVYGRQFPTEGATDSVRRQAREGQPPRSEFIYTHYPPGPDWIAGMLTLVFGVGALTQFRMFPIGIGIISMSFFAWCLVRTIGARRSALAFAAFAAAPMFTNMMHGLHYHSYGFSLFLAELGILLLAFSQDRPAPRKYAVFLFLIGFAEGWLSFDCFFIVALAAAPFWLAFPPRPHSPRARLFGAGILPLIGFGLAHFLHLLQVAAYEGLAGAIGDLGQAAVYRAAASAGGNRTEYLSLFNTYYHLIFSDERFFGGMLALAMILVAVMIVLRRAKLEGASPLPFQISWDVSLRATLAVAAALLVSASWTFVMRNHSAIHTHFIPRHYFLLYFFAVLIIATSLRFRWLSESDSQA